MLADLCVVGAGPAGIAALFEARTRGLHAFAIEEGPSPLTSIQAHPIGLAYLSEAADWEIGTLPFDRRDPVEYSREDILHYYCRVIIAGDLDIRCGLRCTAVRPRPNPRAAAEIDAIDTRGRTVTLRARNIVFTAWYRRRELPKSFRTSNDGSVTVLRHLAEPMQVSGKHVVVYGGGLSAFEQATLLMQTGQSICFAMRGTGRDFHRRASFSSLLKATDSALCFGVELIDARAGALRVRERKKLRQLPCDVLIASIGTQIDSSLLSMLRRSSVLTRAKVAALTACLSVDDLMQAKSLTWREAQLAAVKRPDLYDELVSGERGIRLVGGALHIGANSAGVLVSIETARIAVMALNGEPPPAWLRRPLPEALFAYAESDHSTDAPTVISPWLAALRPLTVRSWSRNWFSTPHAESGAGVFASTEERDPQRFLVDGDAKSRELAAQLLPWCNGERSVRAIARANGFKTPQDEAFLVSLLRHLWSRNVLTWLPPTKRWRSRVRR